MPWPNKSISDPARVFAEIIKALKIDDVYTLPVEVSHRSFMTSTPNKPLNSGRDKAVLRTYSETLTHVQGGSLEIDTHVIKSRLKTSFAPTYAEAEI